MRVIGPPFQASTGHRIGPQKHGNELWGVRNVGTCTSSTRSCRHVIPSIRVEKQRIPQHGIQSSRPQLDNPPASSGRRSGSCFRSSRTVVAGGVLFRLALSWLIVGFLIEASDGASIHRRRPRNIVKHPMGRASIATINMQEPAAATVLLVPLEHLQLYIHVYIYFLCI